MSLGSFALAGPVSARPKSSKPSRTTTTTTTAPTSTTTTVATTTTTTAPATTTTTTPTTAVAAPAHVLAVQGATDAATVSVHISWDRAQADAAAHRVRRDGTVIAVVFVSSTPWKDFSWIDRNVAAGATYNYTVESVLADGTTSPASSPFVITVRGDANLGRIYDVDSYSGTDSDRADAALAAAKAAGGGVVRFGPRTYLLGRPLTLSNTRNVVIRGAGADRTFLQSALAGVSGDACSVTPTELIVVQGTRSTSTAVKLAAPIAVGDRTVSVTSTTGLAVGQVVLLDESHGEMTPPQYDAANIVQDPGTGRDARVPWDANRIVAISGTSVTFQYPWSQQYTTAVAWQTMSGSSGNSVEGLTLQGQSASDTGMYRFVRTDSTIGFTVADVRARWANRNFLELKGFDLRVVGFAGPDGGPASYDGASCKYKITAFRVSNLVVVDSEMGDPMHDRNQSLLTVQKAQRVVVRGTRFWGSRTYGFNEHGAGSRHLIVENNAFAVGPNASFGAILLGNNTWGFAGPVLIRNNQFDGNSRDLAMQENSYEIRFVNNISRNNRVAVIDGYGWAGPDTDPSLYGSLRMTIADNVVTGGAGVGVALGRRAGNYPYLGTADVVIARNSFGVAGAVFALQGSGTRLRVQHNSGPNNYAVPTLDAASTWIGNPDGLSKTGTVSYQPWSARSFAWEQYDTRRPL